MAGETSTELVGMTGRTAESTVRVFVELLRFLREAKRESYEKKLRKTTLNDNRLKSERGIVSTDELVKIANLKNTSVNALPEKLSRKQQDKFIEYAKSMGVPCSIIMKNDKSNEIRECESRIRKLKEKGEHLQAAEKEILNRRTEYCQEVEKSGGVYSDKVLKDFDNQLKIVQDKYNSLEFLSEGEKEELQELHEKLNGDPMKGVRGLYDEHQEASIQYLSKDTATVEYILNQINAEIARENLANKVSELEAKEKDGTITAEEKELLNSINEKDKEIQNSSDDCFNERSKEEIYKDIKDGIEKDISPMDFKKAIDHDITNGTPKVGECSFVYDPDNPNNYVKSTVVEDKNGENGRVIRDYEVYNNGQLQEADAKLGTAGMFTDRYTRTSGGEYRFTDDDGKDVFKNENGRYPKGCRMYWNRMKDDMQIKADLAEKSLYVCRSEQEFENLRTAYNEYINEAKEVGKDKDGNTLITPMENTAYDIKERLPSLKDEIAQISPKIYSVEDKIYNTKDIIDKLGEKGYTYNTEEQTFTERSSGKKISLESLKNQGVKDMKANGDMRNLALYYAGTNINTLVDIGKAQNEYNDLANNINKNLKEIEENPSLDTQALSSMEKTARSDIQKLKRLAGKKEKLVNRVEKNDSKLRNIDLENSRPKVQLSKDKRSIGQNFDHDNLDAKDIYDTNKSFAQWQEKAKNLQKAKTNEQGGNERIKVAEKHIDKDDR